MATTYDGINYFPMNVNFTEENPMELIEAQFGIQATAIVLKLFCKIYKEGYYTAWGTEQCIIFASKAGKGVKLEEVSAIIGILIDKGTFDKASYEHYGILTSEQIQKVWVEATKRRKRELASLPYFLLKPEHPQKDQPQSQPKPLFLKEQNPSGEEGRQLPAGQPEDKNPANNTPSSQNVIQDVAFNEGNVVQDVAFDAENAYIFRQSKVKQSKEYPPSIPPRGDEARKEAELLPAPPGYVFNTRTHNYAGLMEWLSTHKIKDVNEIKSILTLSDYGRKGTKLWAVISDTRWNRIEAPGKYLIAVLGKRNARKTDYTGDEPPANSELRAPE